MRATKSGIVIALALVLITPMTVAAQEPFEAVVEVPDPAGDMYDYSTLEVLDGPEYMDVTLMTLDVHDDEVLLTYEAAGDIPQEIDSMYTTVGWYLWVDADADGEVDRWVAIDLLDGWSASVFDIETTTDTPVGIPAVFDNTLAIRVPLDLLGDPEVMRFFGVMQGQHFPDPTNDPLNWIDWEDRVPEGEDVWLALADASSPDPTASPAAVDLSKYTVAALLSKKPAKIDKAGFRKIVKANTKAVAAYWEAKGQPKNTAPVLTKRLMDIWAIEKPGKRTNGGTGIDLYFAFTDYMEIAQEAAKAGDAEVANAALSIARALHRMARSVLPPPRSWQENWDRSVRQLVKDGILD